MIEYLRYNPETGDLLGMVDAPALHTSCAFRIFGGCSTAKARFNVPFRDAPAINEGEAVVVRRDYVPVFSGRARTVEPKYGSSVQEVLLEGWWQRIRERPAVDPPLLDHIIFGDAPDSDHPEITTSQGVLEWILNNRVLNDPSTLITLPPEGPDPGLYILPEKPTKLTGPFTLYAKDDLTKVLEILATMDDQIIGVGADAQLYYLPRASVTSKLLMTVVAAGPIPADWKHTQQGIPEGDGKFVYDRRGPNHVSIFSRSASDVNAIRDYRLATPLPPGTARTAGFAARNIHTGQQARRLARGLFRRFSNFSMKVEELEVRTGTMRFEPHLGRVRINDEFGNAFAEDLCGSISIEFAKSTIKAKVTLGENAEDPGSDNPLTDPFATEPGDFDEPQIDTGIGNIDYPDPSGEIDFDDGFDGDGDAFHEDEPVPRTIDYGDDEAAEGNGAAPRAAGGAALGVIVDDTSHPSYNVQMYESDGTTPAEHLQGVEMWPESAPKLKIGQKVLVNFPTPDVPHIDGAIGGRGLKMKITAAHPGNFYDFDLLDPSDSTTVIAQFQGMKPYPENTTLAVGQLTFGYWFNGNLAPSPMGGWSCCGGYFQGHDDLGFAGQTITD